MSVAAIKKMPDDHRRFIRRAGGDPDHPDVLKEYLFWANMNVRVSGHGTMSPDRLMSIAATKMREDYDKPRFVKNGGAGPSPQEIIEAEKRKKAEAAGAL